MSEEDKKLQKHLVDEMMKVYETNPNVMIYMQSLMENYEKLEQENKQLKEEVDRLKRNVKEYIYEHRLYQQEVNNYKSILTELEEYCKSWKENEKYCYLASNDIDKCRYDIWGEVLDKIQELKEKYK